MHCLGIDVERYLDFRVVQGLGFRVFPVPKNVVDAYFAYDSVCCLRVRCSSPPLACAINRDKASPRIPIKRICGLFELGTVEQSLNVPSHGVGRHDEYAIEGVDILARDRVGGMAE